MNGKSDIRNELRAISELVADIPIMPVFTVPEGYFEQFPDKLMEKIRESELNDPTFEIHEISPLLASLSRKMPMEAPGGYFDSITVPPVEVKPLAPVIPMRRKRFGSFAIAASMIAILGFGALLFNKMNSGETSSSNLNVSAELPKLSEGEMDAFLDSFPDIASADPITAVVAPVDVEQMISDVDEQGLQDFLSDLPDVKTNKLN